MNPLLARQIRKFLPHVDPNAEAWRSFFKAVSSAYTELEQDRDFLEHTLEVTSDELTEANEKLRRESERRLASVSRYYEQTLDLQQGMILCLDKTPDGFRYTLCRGQLLQRLGFSSPAEIEGKYVHDAAGPAQAMLLNEAFQRVWEGANVSLSFATVDGIELFTLMRPRIEHGVVREIVAACMEVTALKDAERELRAAKERAEAADRAKSEFLAVMSHEIRTPLNAVLGFAEMLKDSPLNAEQQDWAATICTSGESLLALMGDILEYSKIEAGRLVLHPEPISLPSLLDAVVHIFRPRAAAKQVTLTTAIDPSVPVYISIDALRLRQILVNLVGNAVKFTPRGSIEIAVTLAAPATAPGEPCVLRFAVTDSGIGIPAERRERLFKAFSQVDSSSTRQYGGTGLGLAISHRLAHLFGGEIGVDTEPGRGSTFYFTVRAPIVTLTRGTSPATPASAEK